MLIDTRVQRLDYNAVNRTYRRDGVSPTAPVLADGTATFTPGISERRSGVSKFLHQDYLGSTKQITASNQTVTDTRQYDAFGLQTGTTGSTPTPFGFAGGWGYQQDSTGLQLLGHRYYDPSTGRFLTRDPIKDGRNWYGYCDNNPISYLDPDGLARRRARLRPPKEATYEELVQLEVDGVIADAELALAASRSAKALEMQPHLLGGFSVSHLRFNAHCCQYSDSCNRSLMKLPSDRVVVQQLMPSPPKQLARLPAPVHFLV